LTRNQGNAPPMAMETQDLQHQKRQRYPLLHRWRWKPSIYSTSGELLINVT
jgi:hypothetical protein